MVKISKKEIDEAIILVKGLMDGEMRVRFLNTLYPVDWSEEYVDAFDILLSIADEYMEGDNK